jgi:hypothetical protein
MRKKFQDSNSEEADNPNIEFMEDEDITSVKRPPKIAFREGVEEVKA